MIIEYHGHSEFLFESADGYRVLFDPYAEGTGYPINAVRANAVIPSHKHDDHHGVQKVLNAQIVLETAGETQLAPSVKATLTPAYHDDRQGALRGETFLTLLKMDGLSIAHFGDLGCKLTQAQAEIFRHMDILMLPVGGYYTINGEQAAELVRALEPKIAIPMHYQTSWTASWPLETEAPFFAAMGSAAPQKMPIVRVTKADISCLPRLILMEKM